MREILFRGKNYDGEWIEGFFVHQGRCYEIYHKDYEEFPSRFIEPKTVGQYTGLTDKNGKKIFEGDIVKQRGFLNNYYSSVWYAAGRFLVRDYETLLPTALGGISRYEIEVIGNIHDNPELLEEKE